VIDFRPITERDVAQLQDWLGREHVARWWRDEDATTYLARADEHFLIVVDGRPVGMTQTYLVSDYPEWEEVVGPGAGLAGVDLFIGEIDLIGSGLGPQVLAKFARDVVFARPETQACIATVEEENRRSRRAFEKAGFRHVRDVVEDGLPHRLMRLDRAS
jgi:RimJ/RimL family protein N-acetyltransferase